MTHLGETPTLQMKEYCDARVHIISEIHTRKIWRTTYCTTGRVLEGMLFDSLYYGVQTTMVSYQAKNSIERERDEKCDKTQGANASGGIETEIVEETSVQSSI